MSSLERRWWYFLFTLRLFSFSKNALYRHNRRWRGRRWRRKKPLESQHLIAYEDCGIANSVCRALWRLCSMQNINVRRTLKTFWIWYSRISLGEGNLMIGGSTKVEWEEQPLHGKKGKLSDVKCLHTVNWTLSHRNVIKETLSLWKIQTKVWL
jgi:hypothetical protein